MTPRERAEDTLVFYVRTAREAAGLDWDGDNDSEVRGIIDAVLDAALLDTGAEVEALRADVAAGMQKLWAHIGNMPGGV